MSGKIAANWNGDNNQPAYQNAEPIRMIKWKNTPYSIRITVITMPSSSPAKKDRHMIQHTFQWETHFTPFSSTRLETPGYLPEVGVSGEFLLRIRLFPNVLLSFFLLKASDLLVLLLLVSSFPFSFDDAGSAYV